MRIKQKSGRPLTVNIGDRYGLLTVVARVDDGPRRTVRYLCRCDCGNEIEILAGNLRDSKTKSCGCLRRERMRAAARAAANITELMTGGCNEADH